MINDALIESTIRWIRRMYGAWPYALGLPGGYHTWRFCLHEIPMLDLLPEKPLLGLEAATREIEVLMFDFRSPDRRWAYRMENTSSAWLPVEPSLNRGRLQHEWYVDKVPAPGERWHAKGLLTTYVIVRVTDSVVVVRSDLPGAWRTAEVGLNEFLTEWERA